MLLQDQRQYNKNIWHCPTVPCTHWNNIVPTVVHSSQLIICSSCSKNTGLRPKCLNTPGLLSLQLTTAINISRIGHFQQTLCKGLKSSCSQRKGEMMHRAVISKRNVVCLAWLTKAYSRYLFQQQKHKPLPDSYLLNTVAQRKAQMKGFNDPRSAAEILSGWLNQLRINSNEQKKINYIVSQNLLLGTILETRWIDLTGKCCTSRVLATDRTGKGHAEWCSKESSHVFFIFSKVDD